METSHRVTLCGVECAVEEFGSPTGPCMVLLHGWLDNSSSFAPMVPFLSDYRLLAIDFPGHGHSQHLPAGMAYHFMDLVYVIQDLVSFFSLKDYYLIGHSMGGAAATLFASVTPELKKLVLIEALGPLTITPEKTFDLMQKAIRDRTALEQKQLPIYSDLNQAIEARAAVSKMPPTTVRPIVERGTMNYRGGISWRSDPRLRTTSINRLTEPQLAMLLAAIESPTLLIEADAGLFSGDQQVQARKSHFNQLQTELLKGGHHLHMEQPDKVAELIVNFCRDSI